jgi:hypothetical protein
MPKPESFKDSLAENDFAGRLGFGVVLLVVSQWMVSLDGVVPMILRWVLIMVAFANFAILFILFQEQRRKKSDPDKGEGSSPN